MREAKEACDKCAVVEECLNYAMSSGEKFGIWGGTSERQRKKLRREALGKLSLDSH